METTGIKSYINHQSITHLLPSFRKPVAKYICVSRVWTSDHWLTNPDCFFILKRSISIIDLYTIETIKPIQSCLIVNSIWIWLVYIYLRQRVVVQLSMCNTYLYIFIYNTFYIVVCSFFTYLYSILLYPSHF